MNIKLALFLAALAPFLAVAPGRTQTPASAAQPSPGGPASHSELANNDTPQQKALGRKQEADLQRAFLLNDEGERLLEAGQSAAAEAFFRKALALQPDMPIPYGGLAEALYTEGRVSEALQAYHTLLFIYPNNTSSAASETRVLMGYAIALSQAGRWAEAVSVYEKTIPASTNYGDAPKIDIHFDPRVPMPAQLQALAYVASGIEYTGHGQNKKAYLEFDKALHTDPNSVFANYYYGFGWNRLDPKDRVVPGGEQQAKAALRKAVLLGKGGVKKAAQKALLVAMKTKAKTKG